MCSVFSCLLFLNLLVLSGFVLGFGHEVHERRYDHYHGIYSDSELMVDVFNNFGLRILMAHNEHNDNNIAFSPYGIGVILMALGEGLRGEALYEIRKAIYLPYDAHTIRVGLRDIHRHLKSYFIPKEGFLAGITLNIENVSINPEYIQLLKFYGYDIDSFNTALYPENHVTTETGSMGGREETTSPTDDATTPTVPNPETTTVDKDDENSTTENQSTSVENVASTTAETITSTTTDSSTDTTFLTAETTTQFTTTSTEVDTTTSEVATQANTETLEAFSSETIETEPKNTEATTISESEASEVVSTSDPVSTEEVTTVEASIEEGTVSMREAQSGTTTEGLETMGTSSSEGVTTSISTSTDEATQIFTSMTTMATSSTDDNLDTTTTMSTTTGETETTTERQRNIRSSEEFLTLSDVEDSLENEEERNTGKETIYNNKITEKFDSDDWRIRINNQIILLNPEEDPQSGNTVDAIVNNERRNPRSVEEYVISRYYHHHNFRPTIPYKPEEPLYFFVNEKTKEAGLDFMTYDTVLPFLYLSNPNAMALAFPLDSERYYLLLMLPLEGYRMDDLICKLYMHNTFKYVLNNLELTHVRVNIPSFSLTGRITLTNTLQKLGIRRIFEPRQADFSAMTSTEGVYVTNIEQAISVTIKNNLNIKKDTRHGHHYYSEPVRFDVNRPFLYFVIDSELQIILMTGKVVNPLNVRIK